MNVKENSLSNKWNKNKIKILRLKLKFLHSPTLKK